MRPPHDWHVINIEDNVTGQEMICGQAIGLNRVDDVSALRRGSQLEAKRIVGCPLEIYRQHGGVGMAAPPLALVEGLVSRTQLSKELLLLRADGAFACHPRPLHRRSARHGRFTKLDTVEKASVVVVVDSKRLDPRIVRVAWIIKEAAMYLHIDDFVSKDTLLHQLCSLRM